MEEIKEISRIKIADDTYDIKDEELRQMIGDPYLINVCDEDEESANESIKK